MEPFWKDVITWWNIKRSDNINPSDTEILYGYIPESKSFYALNHYLLIAKYHIFRTRNQSESPSLKVFLALLENKIKLNVIFVNDQKQIFHDGVSVKL